ncbi:MAG: SOS response-associated peptidase family protein [Pseudomonadota bacterium]|nr:SOS response-associated peptidase family protein [Pseudomonadota bacterium]
MTRLYRLDAPASDIAGRFGARAGDDPWAGGYIAPEKFAPVITAGREFIAGPRPAGRSLQPRMVPRLWGVLPPPNSDDPTRRITTVRNPESPFWIGNLRNSEFRCLIPATAFMLWGSGTDYEGRRIKHWFGVEGAPLFAFAAVWKDEDIPAFAILTRPPTGPAKAAGASAMPVIIPNDEAAQQIWLHGGWDRAKELLTGPIRSLKCQTASGK